MVELRKRPAPPAAPPPAKKRAAPKPKAKATKKKEDAPAEAAPAKAEEAAPAPASAPEPAAAPVADEPEVKAGAAKLGYTITLEDYGGEVETHEEKKVTLAKLVQDSKAGVVLFTYPKASTPGCTKQAQFFRDAYAAITATGLSIYGLSSDSPKSNSGFKTKQNLPYALLCDPKLTLIDAIGMKKAGNKTTRGVFIVNKDGKVLAAEPGSPADTLEAVKRVVKEMGGASASDIKIVEDKVAAETAAEVADVAATMDKSKTSTPIPT